MTVGTLTHTYTPRGSAATLIESHDPEILIAGPSGTGKSRASLEKMHLAALLNPGMRGLLVRKTLNSLTGSGVVTWRNWVIPESEAAGAVEFYGGSREQPAQYRYSNDSKIMLGGMDKASKVMSTDYDLIFAQEATELTEHDWESLTTRLRNGVLSFQQLLADCNPSHESHWLKKRCDRGQTRMLLSRHEDNPRLFDDDGIATAEGIDYMAKLDALTGPRYQRLRLGKWSSAEGVIYETFDPAVHLLDPFPIPASWPRFWSVDFGFTNPMVVQCWAEDHDGRLYLYREWYRTGRTVPQFCRDIMAVVAPGGEWVGDSEDEYRGGQWIEPKPRTLVCDHDSDRQGTSMRDIMARHLNLSTRPALKEVKVGIQRVTDRFKVAGDGKPRLFLLRDALVEADDSLIDRAKPTCTADELPGYIWDSTPGNEPKESPVKQDDHGADALRYLVMHRDGRPASKVSMSSGSGRLPDRIG